jgi:uncharacterized protein (DUF58 family)
VTRRYHLSLPAVSFMVLVILVAILAMNSQNNLLFWLFGAMVALLFVSGLVSGFMMLGLRVHRIDPRQGAVGEPLVVRYRLVNRNRLLPAFNIHVEDLAEAPVPWRDRLRAALGLAAAAPAPTRDEFRRIMKPARAWVMHVGPRETVHGEAIFWPTGRGPVTFDRVRIWTTFPFGLIKKSVTVRQPSRTLIHPRRYEMRRGVLSAVTPPGPLGMRVTPHAGSGDDYYGLREYRPSDSLRHIAWKRTANLDQVVCVEHTRVSPPKLRGTRAGGAGDQPGGVDRPRRGRGGIRSRPVHPRHGPAAAAGPSRQVASQQAHRGPGGHRSRRAARAVGGRPAARSAACRPGRDPPRPRRSGDRPLRCVALLRAAAR